MGSNVRQPNIEAPPKTRIDKCPHCQAAHRVINGAWLRWKRELIGLDQRSFAQLLGISGPYLSDIERNRRVCPDIILSTYKALHKEK